VHGSCDEGAGTSLRAFLRHPIDNLSAAFRALTNAGRLEVRPGSYRRLTDTEKLNVVAAIRQNDPALAVTRYFAYALDGNIPDVNDPDELMVKFPALCLEASKFVWSQMRVDVPATAQREFLASLKGRSLLTVRDIERAYAAWESNQSRGLGLRNVPTERKPELGPTKDQIEEMSDEEIAKLYHQTRVAARLR
jgi:hypothetical protein